MWLLFVNFCFISYGGPFPAIYDIHNDDTSQPGRAKWEGSIEQFVFALASVGQHSSTKQASEQSKSLFRHSSQPVSQPTS